MNPSKEQVVHDLAMACVNGVVQNMVMMNGRDCPNDDVFACTFANEVIQAYKEAWDSIYPEIEISDD